MSANIDPKASPPAEMVIVLKKPIELGELTYTTLTLREPTAAEWELWSHLSGVAADIAAVAVVSGVPEPVVRKLPVRQLLEGSRYLGRFLD